VRVDVFTERALAGNPLAVFLEPDGLFDQEMQALAREMNLSETVFVLPTTRPDCAARLRIFTPTLEIPFAGHPTVGTAWVLATRRRLPHGAREVALEEGIGPVPVRLEGDPARPNFVWMRHRDPVFGPTIEDRAGVARALGLDEGDLLDAPIEVGSTGNRFLFVPLRDRAIVDRVRLDLAALDGATDRVDALGVFVLAPEPPDRVYSRMLAPGSGVPEDPATGSASGPLAGYLVRHRLVPAAGETRLVSEQGTKMGRQSFVHMRLRAEGGQAREVEVGGATVEVLTGTLTLP
jgi:trans-2,3-dihydro-3-hydroxyanthranilate isomerase